MANSLYESHLQRIMLFDVFIKTNTCIHAVQVNEHNCHNPLQSQPIESHRQRELALKLVGQVNFSLQIKFIARTGYVDIMQHYVIYRDISCHHFFDDLDCSYL